MGSFSWLKADDLTNTANIVNGKPFKFLVPKEFGGGFIKDYYQDYGYLGINENNYPKYDMYEILAFWNYDLILKNNRTLKSSHNFENLKSMDEFTDHNRNLGIDIGCYNDQIDQLIYPLKLVSCGYKGTYEDLKTYSYGDPFQGFGRLSRENLHKEFNHIKPKEIIKNKLNTENFLDFLIEEFLNDKNTVIPKNIYDLDKFWINTIKQDKSYIEYLPDILKNDLEFIKILKLL